MAPVAALFTTTQFGPIFWWAVVAAVPIGWFLGIRAVGSAGLVQVGGVGLAFGLLVALAGVTLFVVGSMLSALLPGSTVSRAETPFGYLIMLALSLVSLTWIVVIPTTAAGIVWVALVRLLGRTLARA